MPPDQARVTLNGENGGIELAGPLSFDTVTAACGQFTLPGSAAEISVNLAGVTRSDSAGLALLVHWISEARRAGRSLKFLDVPDQLMSIARVCGVAQLLDSH